MVSIVITSALLLASLLLVPQIFGDFIAYQLGLYLIYGIVAQGIGYLWGKTSILPLGQTLFFGGAAYASAIILKNVDGLILQLPLLLLAVALAGLIAYTLGSVIFKGRDDSGPYFSLITLALVMIAEQVANTSPELTGGFNGMSGFTPIGGLDPYGNFYYLIVAVVITVTTLLLTLDRLPANLITRAISDNEPRLQLLGFATHRVKGLAFAFSAVLAAIAGILYASHQEIVTPTSTGFALSAELVILTAVGGRFHVLGPLLGTVLIGYFSSELRDTFQYWEIGVAVLFIIVVLKAPGGLIELLTKIFKSSKIIDNLNIDDFVKAPQTNFSTVPAPLKFSDTYLNVGVVKILNGVSFETNAQGIVCVIGPNGAGKTSMLNAITGNLQTTGGAILLGDLNIDRRAPYEALNSGIGRKLQVPSVFFSMSVEDNLAISMLAGRAKFRNYFSNKPLKWRSLELNKILHHKNVPLINELHRPVSELPQGHRQFLEFAMTAASEPRLLLLDEPCAGLSHDETALMTELVEAYQDDVQGLVIVIEHDMSIVEKISDKVLVLHHGQVLAFDSYNAVKADPNVTAVYAGGTK